MHENDNEYLDEWNKIKNFAFVNCKGQPNIEICSKLLTLEAFCIFNLIINYYKSLPVSTVAVERGFSEMNYSKIDLRDRMTEELLDELLGILVQGPA